MRTAVHNPNSFRYFCATARAGLISATTVGLSLLAIVVLVARSVVYCTVTLVAYHLNVRFAAPRTQIRVAPAPVLTKNQHKMSKGVLRCLPSDVLSHIESYIGYCPLQVARKKAMLSILATGKIGIVQWIIDAESWASGVQFHYEFVVPCHEHFEMSQVRGCKRPFVLREDYATAGYTDRYRKYIYYMGVNQIKLALRKCIFMPRGSVYAIGNEGGGDVGFDLTYDNANNLDMLYILKYTRGTSPREALESIQQRFDFLNDCCIDEDKTYQTRIMGLLATKTNHLG